MNRKRSVLISIGIIVFVSMFQPYFVLITRYGPSKECWKCLIIEQTFLDSLFFLVLPMSMFYIGSKAIKLNSWIYTSAITVYFAIISFIKLTIPLFDDRIASWSTFSDGEVPFFAFLSAFPSLLILSILFFLVLRKVNVK